MDNPVYIISGGNSLKKQIYAILAGLVCIAILVVALFIVNKLPSKDEKENLSSASQVSILQIDKSSIKNIKIKNSENQVNIEVSQNSDTTVYSVKELDQNQPIEKQEIESILNVFSNFSADKLVEENTSNLSKFGFNESSPTIKISTFNGEDKTLQLGKTTPLNSGYYLKLSDSDNIYLVSNQLANKFFMTKEDFIESKSDASSADQASENVYKQSIGDED